MGAKEHMASFIVKRRLLSSKVPEDCKTPLEGWLELKAKKTFSKSKEMRSAIGKNSIDIITRKDFEEYQLFRVREQIRYAMENVPYYRDLYKKVGIVPEEIRTYDDLLKLPLTEPIDLSESPRLFYGVSSTKMAREFTTTGTSGHRKFIGFTASDLISKIDIIASALKDIGMKKGDSLHIMFPTVSAWDPSLMMSSACELLGYGSSTCSDTDIKKQMEVIKEAGSSFIIGLPSFINRVTSLVKKDELKSLHIKKIISTSEPLSESMRGLLQNAWGCPVIDVWGMTEFGLACAVECDCRNGLHTDEANMLMEIIDPDTGEHVPHGEEGELVITSLTSQGTVLIRYRTRDITHFIEPPCECGMKFSRRIAKPCGRLDLQMKIGMGRKIYPIMFDEALFIDSSVVDYHIEIVKNGYKDMLNITVECVEKRDDLVEKLTNSVCEIREIAEGIEEDLVSTPTIILTSPSEEGYHVKAKKIVDARS